MKYVAFDEGMHAVMFAEHINHKDVVVKQPMGPIYVPSSAGFCCTTTVDGIYGPVVIAGGHSYGLDLNSNPVEDSWLLSKMINPNLTADDRERLTEYVLS